MACFCCWKFSSRVWRFTGVHHQSLWKSRSPYPHFIILTIIVQTLEMFTTGSLKCGICELNGPWCWGLALRYAAENEPARVFRWEKRKKGHGFLSYHGHIPVRHCLTYVYSGLRELAMPAQIPRSYGAISPPFLINSPGRPRGRFGRGGGRVMRRRGMPRAMRPPQRLSSWYVKMPYGWGLIAGHARASLL